MHIGKTAMGLNGNEKDGAHFIGRLRDRLGWMFGMEDDVSAPIFEGLEPRVLLSANPVADMLKERDGGVLLNDNQAVISMPRSNSLEGQAIVRMPGSLQCSAQVSILSPENNAFYRGTVDVKASIAQGAAPVLCWVVELVNETTGKSVILKSGYGVPESEFLVSFDAQDYDSGAYRIDVMAIGEKGELAVASRSFVLDVEAPVVDIVHNAHSPLYTGQKIECAVKATDNIGVVERSLFLNGQNVELDANGNAGLTFDAVGTYVIVATAVDAAGNIATKTLAFEVVAAPDTEEPVVTVMHDAIGPVYPGQPVLFVVDATDNVGVVSRHLVVNGRAVALDDGGSCVLTFDAVGTYMIIATATDAAGNTGGTVLYFKVVAAPDAEKPVVTVTHDAPSPMYPGQSVNFTVGATDNVGVVSRSLTLNGTLVSLDADGKCAVTLDAVGTYTIVATATDAAGNVGETVITLEVIAAPDTEKPVVTVTHDAPTPMYPGQSVNFTVGATDNVGVVSRSLTLNGTLVSLDADGKCAVTLDAVGTYTIVATAVDAAGNVGETVITLEVVAAPDTEKPVVTVTHDAPSPMYPGQSVNFTVEATDNVGVVSRSLTINGTSVALDADGKCAITLDAVGTYTIVATAMDAAGNVGETVITLEVVAAPDTEKPVVTVTHDAPSPMYPGQSVNFGVEATDNVGVVSRSLTLNGTLVSLDADGKCAVTLDAVGTYTIVATATDAAGNVGETVITLEVVAAPDTEKPVVTVTHDAPSPMYPGQSVNFTVEATDNVGVVSRSLTINGTSVSLDADGKCAVTLDAVGTYTIVGTATDAAGNVGETVITFEVVAAPDTEKPVVTVTHDAPSPMYPGQSVNFAMEATDNVGVVSRSLTINGTSVALDADGKCAVTFDAVGTYTIVATATDAAGNVGETVITLEVVAAPDTEKPVVTVTHDAPSPMYPGQSVNFAVEATDNVGVVSRSLTINGTSVALDADGKCAVTFDAVGTYTIVATATDAAGNVGQIEVVLVVVSADTTPPEISYVSVADKAVWNTDIPVTISVTDPGGEVASWRLRLVNNDTGVETVIASGKGAADFLHVATLKISEYADASYTLIVEALDTAWNYGERRTDFAIDSKGSATRPPEFPYLSVADKVIWNTDIPVMISVTDPDGDLAGWRVKLVDRSTGNVTIVGTGTGTVEFETIATLQLSEFADGAYRIVVEAWDAAGNRGERNFDFIIDRTAPVTSAPEIPYLSVADKKVWNTDIPVTISITDRDGDIDAWNVKLIDKATGNMVIIASGTGAVDFQTVATLSLSEYANGSYRIVVEAWDKVGNRNERHFNFVIDDAASTTKGPEFPHLSVAEKEVWTTDIPVVVSVTDPDGDIALWRVKLYDHAGKERIIATGKGEALLHDAATLETADYPNGSYRIVVEAWDAEGNRRERSFDFVINAPTADTEKPVVELSHNAPTPLHPGQEVTITVKATDNVGVTSRELTINGKAVALDQDGRCVVTFTAVGTYTILAKVFDAAGNEAIALLIFEVVPVDPVKP